MSVLSRATYAPRPAATPAFTAAEKPRFSPSSTTLASGHSSLTNATEPSDDPLSTTITSKSRKLCSARVSRTISRKTRPSRGVAPSRFGITIETFGSGVGMSSACIAGRG